MGWLRDRLARLGVRSPAGRDAVVAAFLAVLGLARMVLALVDVVLATAASFGIPGLLGAYTQTRRAYTAELVARAERLERSSRSGPGWRWSRSAAGSPASCTTSPPTTCRPSSSRRARPTGWSTGGDRGQGHPGVDPPAGPRDPDRAAPARRGGALRATRPAGGPRSRPQARLPAPSSLDGRV